MTDLAMPPSGASRPARTRVLRDHFYLLMSVLVAVVVTYGFSFTIGDNLVHPAVARPSILYVHAAVSTGWLVFFALQTALVRARNVRAHRTLGLFGMVLGAAITVVGVWTAVAMGRFRTVELHQADAAEGLIVPLWDMVVFTAAFWLAMSWRRRPETHRRLVFVATCALTAAAFGRFPERLLPAAWFYVGVDALILLGVARDLVVDRAVHRVYAWTLPPLVVGQIAVMYVVAHRPALWLGIARALTR